MATPSSAVASRMAKMGLEVQRGQRTAMNRAALEAKKVLVTEIAKAVPSGRMRNVGSPPGARVGVKYDVKGTKNPTALVRAIGPLHLVENPIKPHMIIPKKTGRGAKGRGSRRANQQALYDALFGGRYAGQKPLRTPYGPRYRVEHPGVSTPKRPWAKGMKRVPDPVRRTLERTYLDAFRRGAKR